MDEPKTNETQKTEEAKNACAQCGEYLAGWKRAQADYANLKRETEKEKIEFSKFANERLLSNLLPAIDSFDTALAFVPDVTGLPDDRRDRIEKWIAGMRAVRQLWENAFREIGLENVPTSGAFDPLIHEAVGEERSETTPQGTVIRTVQSGWRLNGKLLRPAKVIVSKR